MDSNSTIDIDINDSIEVSDDWKKIKDIDYLFASRLVRDARDLRNLTFKKTKIDFEYALVRNLRNELKSNFY